MLPGSTAMSRCTPAPPLSFTLPLSHANTHGKKNILFQFFVPLLILSPLPRFHRPISLWPHFLCPPQVSLWPSVGATCRSGTSPRETVGLTTWKSASAGAAACPGLMSPWRYAAERAAHSTVRISAAIDPDATGWWWCRQKDKAQHINQTVNVATCDKASQAR